MSSSTIFHISLLTSALPCPHSSSCYSGKLHRVNSNWTSSSSYSLKQFIGLLWAVYWDRSLLSCSLPLSLVVLCLDSQPLVCKVYGSRLGGLWLLTKFQQATGCFLVLFGRGSGVWLTCARSLVQVYGSLLFKCKGYVEPFIKTNKATACCIFL